MQLLITSFVVMNLLRAVSSQCKPDSPTSKRLQESCTKDTRNYPKKFTEEELRERLTSLQYRVTQTRGTESQFSGEYLKKKDDGIYVCVVCGNILFDSNTKYESGSGWPAFWDVAQKGNVQLVQDNDHGMRRIEVKCASCGAHLGHVFDDGPQPTKTRYCVNSASLKFKKHTTV